MFKRSYFNGLLTGGFVGAILSMIVSSRQKPQRKLMLRPGKMGDQAKRVFRGISRGMVEMLRR